MAARTLGAIATGVSGLYYTGENSSGGLIAAGSTDSAWKVTYASTNGGSSESTAYEGSSYVVNNPNGNYGWLANTSNAQWITAPGATNSSGGSKNTGQAYLPGNGTGSHEGVYVYTLTFTITGTGSGALANFGLNITAAADDIYSVYVNPKENSDGLPTGKASYTDTDGSDWIDTTQFTLNSSNANFKIGTNTLVFVVDNTNNISGTSSSTSVNASGLFVYELNALGIPEVGTWAPLAAALGAYGVWSWRRRRRSALS